MQILACTENIWNLVGKGTVQCSALSVTKEVSLERCGIPGKITQVYRVHVQEASWKRTGDVSLEVTRRPEMGRGDGGNGKRGKEKMGDAGKIAGGFYRRVPARLPLEGESEER